MTRTISKNEGMTLPLGPEDGEFVKRPTVIRAKRIMEPFIVETVNGPAHGKAGDMLIVDMATGDQWPHDYELFLRNYERVEE